jgi:HEAT repeat protein
LEDSTDNLNTSDQKDAANAVVYVLLRIDHGAMEKVRLVPAGCTLNAGGLPLQWLTGVQPEDSAAYLGQVAAKHADERHDKLLGESLVALSTHATSKATEVLASLAAPSNGPYLREKAAFWLGAQRGHGGYLALQRLVTKEQDPKLREKLAFDLSINSDPAAVDELITMAKSDSDGGVRGQALFWLAQKAGKKAIGALRDSMENDPDFSVKKKAVFALSQLPKDESVPQLIHVADSNSNFAIRKEAMFWLGQTNDPRALAYLEEVLKR